MNRKTIKAMLVSALAIGTISSGVAFAEDSFINEIADTRIVSTKSATKGQVIKVSANLNIRKSASTSSDVIGKMPLNTKFDIISKKGNWYKIKYGSVTGYVSADYVKVIANSTDSDSDTSNSNSDNAQYGKGQVIKVSANLNIRKSASTSSDVVGKMPLNTKFDIISKKGNWYKIKYGSVTGYVSADYVKVISGPSNDGSNSGGSSSGGSDSGNSNSGNTKYGKGQVIKVSANLNIRKSASTSSSVIGKMPLNAKFDIISKSGNWYKIKYGSVTGYVSADYVKVISEPSNDGSNDNSNDSSNNGGSNSGDNNSGGSVEFIGKGQVIKVSANLNIRKSASTSSDVVGKMPLNAKFDIISKKGNWYKIKYGSVTGYVSADYVKVISTSDNDDDSSNGGNNGDNSNKPDTGDDVLNDKYGIVTGLNEGTSLRVRKEPNTTSDVLGHVTLSQKVQIVGKNGNWYKITFNNGFGYVSADFITIVDYDPDKPQDEDTKEKFEKVLNKMKTQLGSPYVYGGAGEIITRDLIKKLQGLYPGQQYSVPDEYYDKEWRAFDCSGLMYWGFKEAGVTLGRSTSSQINNGVEVSLDNLQPGDLIFYKTLNHVGMYIGNGKWIESPRTGLTVRITDVPWNLVGRARRVI